MAGALLSADLSLHRRAGWRTWWVQRPLGGCRAWWVTHVAQLYMSVSHVFLSLNHASATVSGTCR